LILTDNEQLLTIEWNCLRPDRGEQACCMHSAYLNC